MNQVYKGIRCKVAGSVFIKLSAVSEELFKPTYELRLNGFYVPNYENGHADGVISSRDMLRMLFIIIHVFFALPGVRTAPFGHLQVGG